MKRSIIGRLLIPVVLVVLCLSAQTADALDAPHNNLDKNELITCSSCHYSAASPPAWVSSATPTGDTTKWNLLCFQCHSTGNLPHGAKYEDVQTHSSAVIESAKYGTWNVECRVCHSAHYQQQALSYSTDAASYLATGTVGGLVTAAAAVTSTITDTSAPFVAGAYENYLLIPNLAYPTTMYRIQGNTNSVITVYGAINPYYASVGKTYAIKYGKMVNQSIETPSSGMRQVKYYDATGVNSFGSGTTSATTAVCQVCHTSTTSFNNSGAQEAGLHPTGVVAANQPCTDCHSHASGFKPGGCTNCHGTPPVDSGTLVFKDKDGTDVTSQSPGAGAHLKHTTDANLSCSNCHTGGMTSAQAGDFRINLGLRLGSTDLDGNYDTTSRITYTVIGTPPTTVTYGGSLQCSNLYCHSTVQADGGVGAPTYKTPTWTGTVACGDCHNADGVPNTMDTGGHTSHLASTVGATCDTCHSGNTHANGNIEVTNVSYTMGGTPSNGYGSCSAASCHMSAYDAVMVMTPTWGNSAGCTACHTVPIDATGPNTGSHAVHNVTDCSQCHAGALNSTTTPTLNHTDGNIDATNGYPATVKHAAGTYAGTCNSASCHQTGISTNDYTITPVWGDTTAPNCTVCHAAVPATGAHSVHVTSSSYDCSQCHTGAIKDTSYASAQHRDLNIDISVGGYPTNRPMGSAKQSCSATQCHGTTSPAWDNLAGTTGDCSLCHGMSANPADGRDTAGHTAPTDSQVGAHVAHLTGTSNYSSVVVCSDCHAVPASVAAAGHIDSALPAEVVFSGLSVSNSAAANYNTGTCSTVYCHGGKMIYLSTNGTDTRPVWNAISYLNSIPSKTGDCGVCHGAPPSGYAPNSHSGSETLAECSGCHNHLRSDGTFSAPALHIDGTVQASGCTGCHGQPPVDAATMVTSPPAGAETGRKVGFASSNGGAGAHDFHMNSLSFVSCNRCHSGGGGGTHQTALKITFGFTYGLNKGTYTAPALSNGYTLTSGDPGTTVGTSAARNCTNYCHSSGQAANGQAGDPVFATPDWDNIASGDCGACHVVAGMNTGSHTKHIAADSNCGNCHTDATLSSYASTSHVNTSIDVATSLSYTGSGLAGNGYATCQAASCHDTGRNVIVATPLWGTTINDCSTCHAKQPATGSHTKHLTGTAYHKAVCGDCHGTAVEGSTAMASHPTGSVDVYDVAAGDLGYPAVAKHNNDIFQSCTTAYCHSSGQAADGGSTPVYSSVTWSSGSLNCGSCHKNMDGDSTAPGSHVAHAQSAAISCGNCHNGYTETTANVTTHVDKLIFTSFTGTAAGTTYSQASTSAVGNNFGTCSASSCHGSATVAWGANTTNNTCTKCHGTGTAGTVDGTNRYVVAPPQDLAGNSGTYSDLGQVSNDPQVGAHQTHLRVFNGLTSTTGQFTLDNRCEFCHGTLPTSGMHANGSAVPVFSGLSTSGGKVSAAYSNGACSNTYCHNPAGATGGLAAGNAGLATAPTWTQASYVSGNTKTQTNCNRCHLVPDDGAFTSSTNHTGYTVSVTDCSGCHGHNGDNQGSLGQRHMDGIKYGGGSCDSCHGYQTTSWASATQRAIEGKGAHAKHVAYLATLGTVTSNPATDQFGNGVFWDAVCGKCHGGATHTTSEPIGGTGRQITVASEYVFSTGTTTYNAWNSINQSSSVNPKTCSNISCHYQTTPVWSAY